jgi:hypothetical protein
MSDTNIDTAWSQFKSTECANCHGRRSPLQPFCDDCTVRLPERLIDQLQHTSFANGYADIWIKCLITLRANSHRPPNGSRKLKTKLLMSRRTKGLIRYYEQPECEIRV